MSDEKSALGQMADRAQEMMGGMAGMATAATAGAMNAATFVANAAIGNAYELEAAKLALSRGRSDGLLALARDMLDDHTTGSHQLMSTLRSIKDAPALPTPPLDSRRADMVEHLRQTPDDQFEGRFIEQQILAHQENVTLFQGYSSNGDDPRLRLFAAGALPAMERHLEALKAIRRH